MNARQLHHQSATRTFLHAVEPEDFIPMRLTGKALSEDSCWGEYESDYAEESLPGSLFSRFDDDL